MMWSNWLSGIVVRVIVTCRRFGSFSRDELPSITLSRSVDQPPLLRRASFRAQAPRFPVLIFGLMELSRDQVGQCGKGVLGIATLGFDSQHRVTLGG